MNKHHTGLVAAMVSTAFYLFAMTILIASAFSGCSLSSSTSINNTAGTSTRVGGTAPDFMLPGLDGTMVTLDQYRGSPVLLNFWATWCGPCRTEMPFLEEVYREWEEKGLVMLAVNVGETAATVQSFMDENGFTMPVLLDRTQATSRNYNITGIPTTFILDKDGIIREKVIGIFTSVNSIEQRLESVFP